jgi:hypothetical protein
MSLAAQGIILPFTQSPEWVGFQAAPVWVIMIVVAFGMPGSFWRRGWIGNKERRVKEE